MIQADSFVEAARRFGFRQYTGVPCSFLTPFINYIINDDSLSYISSANEGDALATAAGAAIGGIRSVVMMQNSGLGNAVSPLTSLTHVFRIPVLIIVTHRGAPGVNDEPQHELMGRITAELFDTMNIPWEAFPDTDEAVQPTLERACQYMFTEHRPYALIMAKGTVAPHTLHKSTLSVKTGSETIRSCRSTSAPLAQRREVLERVIHHTPETDCVVIATTGYTGRELFALNDRANQLYMVGSMGCASSLALGLALAQRHLKIVVVDGDGAALMRMGNFATLGYYGGKNLVHLLLDNEAHDSTGAQATVSGSVRFATIAQACGYSVCYEGNSPGMIDDLLEMQITAGPTLGHIKIDRGTLNNLPRPDITPHDVLRRLMKHINTEF